MHLKHLEMASYYAKLQSAVKINRGPPSSSTARVFGVISLGNKEYIIILTFFLGPCCLYIQCRAAGSMLYVMTLKMLQPVERLKRKEHLHGIIV